MSLEIWRSSAASRIFNVISPDTKLPHSRAEIRRGEGLVPRIFNQLGMNFRRPMTLFPQIFDENSPLHGSGKRREDLYELLSSSDFISDEDWHAYFHMTLAAT
jgi:hypothetical protein